MIRIQFSSGKKLDVHGRHDRFVTDLADAFSSGRMLVIRVPDGRGYVINPQAIEYTEELIEVLDFDPITEKLYKPAKHKAAESPANE